MTAPHDTHEWVSFEDDDLRHLFMFDVTFLESNWTCIFNCGCQGVLTAPTPELAQGCCSYGAHFSDEKDRKRVEKAAKRLTADQWQFIDKGKKDGVTKTKKNGEMVTRQVQDACIFLNRPDFHRGPGCALHVLAMDNNESYIPLKPEVCWMVPLRREDDTQEDGSIVTRVGQWDRQHWGDGGQDFAWWCTNDDATAYVGDKRVVDSMREELIAMVGEPIYNKLLGYMNERRASAGAVWLGHPVRRK